MSGRDVHHHQEALEELIRDIQETYDEELHRSQSGDTERSSVRNLRPSSNNGAVSSRLDVLESWRSLVFALEEHDVFGRYTTSLEQLFAMDIPDPAIWRHIKVLLDLTTETVIHHDADQASTECRYITLLEIMSSFREQSWSPSRQIQHEWGAFNEPIPPDMTPSQFRKAAYNVLMSLPWVPSSHGLKEACMISEEEDRDENNDFMTFDTSAVDQSIFDQIRGAPLPRVDYMHRLLVKFDGALTTGAITAMPKGDPTSIKGIGKTTLACMLASHHQIQSQYTVLWLRLNHDRQAAGGLSCSQYITYLDSLCKQLGQTIKWPEQIRILEETSFRQKREERRMHQVKRIMADVLSSVGSSKPVLLVLDDVNDNQEMEWFQFGERQTTLVTTNSADLNVDWTLELDVLSEDEALDLFLAEAEFPLDHVLSTSLEAQTTVERCGYHPLVVRTASRWFHLKQATAGFVKGLEELDQELSSCIARLRYCRPLSSTTLLLTEIMDLMLSPLSASGQPTTLMKLCLASMAVVFRGRVPLDAVQLLWAELLRTDPDAIQELGNGLTPSQLQKRARFISEALISLGMLSVVEDSDGRFVEIHHELQTAYARRLAQDMQVRNTEIKLSQLWHEAFAKAYISKRLDKNSDDAEDNCRAYAMEKLVNHMVEAKMLRKAASLLMDKTFLEQRLSIKGFDLGAQTHLEDCAVLYLAMKAEDHTNGDDPRQMLLSILLEMSTFLVAKASRLLDRDAISDIATTIHKIGFALAGRKFLSKASSQYKTALKLLTKTNPLAGTVYYSLSAINLEKEDVAKAQKHIKSCFKVMGGDKNPHHPYYREALLLNSDIQVAACNYRGALKCYNQAIQFLLEDEEANLLELGIVLDKKANLLLVMGDAEEALDVAKGAVKRKEELNVCSYDLGLLYRLLGDIHCDTCNDNDAERYYVKALRVWEHTADRVNQEDILMTNGRISYLHGDTTQCFGSFCDAIKTVKSPRINDLCWFARKYSSEGENDKAISVLREALTLPASRPDSLERASILFDLGSCYVAQEDFLRALSSLDKSLDIRTRILGESETTLQTIELIGDVHLREGATKAAAVRYNEALQMAESMYGQDNERVASILFALGELKLGNGENADGLALLMNCLELRRKHLGPNHPDLASVLERIGEIHYNQGMYDKTYKYHAECLKIRQANFATDDPLLADSMHNMGKVTRKRGDCERGLHFLLDALHIRSKLKDQQAACDTLLEIGHVHRQSRDPESAAGCYKKCLEILVANLRYHSECGAAVYLSLGHAHKDLGQTEDALQNYEKALTIRKDLLGQDHILTAAVYRSLGIMEFQLGRYDDAMKHLVEFLRIHNDSHANASIDYVLALLFLGDLYQRASKSDRAKSSWTTALQAFQQQTDISNKCPELGPQLERRLNQLEKAREAKERRANNNGGMKREGSVFARLSADLVSRLSDEQLPVHTKVTPTPTTESSTLLQLDPEEDEIHNSIFLDD